MLVLTECSCQSFLLSFLSNFLLGCYLFYAIVFLHDLVTSHQLLKIILTANSFNLWLENHIIFDNFFHSLVCPGFSCIDCFCTWFPFVCVTHFGIVMSSSTHWKQRMLGFWVFAWWNWSDVALFSLYLLRTLTIPLGRIYLVLAVFCFHVVDDIATSWAWWLHCCYLFRNWHIEFYFIY